MGGAVDWGTNVPVPVAMSSGESEYLGTANCCMIAAYFRMLMYDTIHLGTEEHSVESMDEAPSSLVVMDSQAAIWMAAADRDTQRTRHISRRFHFVREGVARQQHSLVWIGTKSMVADILTKCGSAVAFTHLWALVLVEVEDVVN